MAEDLAGRPVDRLIPCRNGRNSRVYKAVCGNDSFALKSYPPKASDPRDRFGTEIKALKFYQANRNPHTSRLLAVDMPRGIALLEWIDGCLIDTPAASDIALAVDFIARTHAAETNGGEAFALASEPCLCGADLDRHLALRLAKLSAVKQEPELNYFLTHELSQALASARSHAAGATFATQLPRRQQSLIPADFGFHNALKTVNGGVYFIDFEYFGWDDPVRLTADFLLHPGMALDPANRERFRRGMIDTFKSDEAFEQRLLQLLPLYGIRWALILLNEFLPERWQARVFAGETASWQDIKLKQLEKARTALDKAIACLKLS
jgi:hypothetical protein